MHLNQLFERKNQSSFGSHRLKMSVRQRLGNQSKLIAVNVLKVCREEKQNGELFLPLASHLARALCRLGFQSGHLLDSEQ